MRYFCIMKHSTISEVAADKASAVRATVAHNFSTELKRQRWSQRAAATALGLTPRYLNARATGDVDMSASDLALFAEFLNVSIGRFFDEVRDDSSNVVSINVKKAPTPKSEGRTVGPAGFDPTTSTVKTWISDAVITPITSAPSRRIA